MLSSVLADATDDSNVTVNLWQLALVLVILAAIIYIVRRTFR